MYTGNPHTDQYLVFDSHLPVSGTQTGSDQSLHHQAENVPTRMKGKKKEHNHIKKAKSVIILTVRTSRSTSTTDKEENNNKQTLYKFLKYLKISGGSASSKFSTISGGSATYTFQTHQHNEAEACPSQDITEQLCEIKYLFNT